MILKSPTLDLNETLNFIYTTGPILYILFQKEILQPELTDRMQMIRTI